MTSGKVLPKVFNKGQNQFSYMQDRIGFKDDTVRKEFFSSVREVSGVSTWKELSMFFNLRRTEFQQYQYGQILLPKNLFDSMMALLPNEKESFFLNQIFIKPWNWGFIKGGQNNYKKNSTEIIKRLRKGFKEKVIRDEKALQPVDLSLPLSKEFCEFIGAFIGDGCIDSYIDKNGKSKYHINITGDAKLDKNYLTEVMPSIVKNIFNIKPHIFFRNDSNAMTVNFYSRTLFTFLTKRFGFPAGKKTLTVKIPDEIFTSCEEFLFATIRGIFDTDGCVFLDKRKSYKIPYPRITLQIRSRPLFLQLKSFLSNYFSLYATHNIKKDHYYLDIYGHKQFTKWMQLIGFSNQKHLTRIQENYKPWAGFEPAVSS